MTLLCRAMVWLLALTRLVVDLGEVGALDLGGDAYESLAECVLGRGEDHLLLDLGVIGGPAGRWREGWCVWGWCVSIVSLICTQSGSMGVCAALTK